MLRALKEDVVQKEISKTANEKLRNIHTRKEKIVGTNMYPNLQEKPLASRVDERKQAVKERVRNIKEYKTNKQSIAELLRTIRKTLNKDEQPLNRLIEATKKGGQRFRKSFLCL